MRAYQVDLQFANLVAGNANIAQFADAGSDCVGHLLLATISSTTARAWFTASRASGASNTGAPLHRDLAHSFQRQIVSTDMKCVQRSPQ